MLPSTKNRTDDGRMEDDVNLDKNSSTEAAPIKEHPEHHQIQKNVHLPTCNTSVEQRVCDDHVFGVGSIISVKISCIESLKKFWCQTTDDDSLTLLMNDIQSRYASARPQPFVELVCVARNPDNGIWYRARIIYDSPVVDVRFIDYGQTQTVSLQDVHLIDPDFLLLDAQAFQCCLCNLKHPTNPAAATWNDAALSEFENFVDSASSTNAELKCVVKAVTSDQEGLLLHVVDIETPCESASKLLAEKCRQAEDEDEVQIPSLVSSDPHKYSTYNIEVGGKENVWVSSSENVNHFYCQLDKNSELLKKIMKDIKQVIGLPQHTDQLLGVNSVCLARYSDNQWYRGQVTETSPNLKVRFVDYGDTLAVKESDIRPFPTEASAVRSVPEQAIPLELFDVPADVPQEVNKWFADHAVGHNFTISVVEKGPNGKLIVKLYDGSLEVNKMIRARIAKVKQGKTTEKKLSTSSKQAGVQKEHCETQNHMNISPLRRKTKQNEVHNSIEVKTKSPATISTSEPECRGLNEVRKQNCRSVRIADLPPRLIKEGSSAEVYISHFNSPSSLFVQLQREENEMHSLLKKLNELADGVPINFSDLQIDDVVNAQFDDSCWYRAVVRCKHKDNTVDVEFIDYGNEATILSFKISQLDKELVAFPKFSIPCALMGGDNKHDKWDDESLSAFKKAATENPEKTFTCSFVRETVNVWDVILKDKEVVLAETPLQSGYANRNIKQPSIQEESVNICTYKMPNIFLKRTEEVYASCIVGPDYFWCQHSNTEDLNEVLKLSQKVGQAEMDTLPKTLDPGSPCLALFSSDNQWYRAQVTHKTDTTLSVLYIDYGNEAEVGINHVRLIPPSLFEKAPQAFLCSLDGFDESKGSWDDRVYDDFYSLLVDKPLSVTIFDVEDNTEIRVPQYVVKIECENVVVNAEMQKYWKAFATEHAMTEELSSLQDGCTKSEMRNGKLNICKYKKPNISASTTEEVYASCIVGPQYFWCQYSNTKDLNKLSELAQEVGRSEPDVKLSETLDPGSPCLALFSSDNQWYRAQVTHKTDNTLNVLFIDYGNEADVDIKDVRSIPPTLLEAAPQAFLCSLGGFDESKCSWDDNVYDDFYSLLVDKPLSVTVLNMEDHTEIGVPLHTVKIECENMDVASEMQQRYWKGFATERTKKESPETVHQDKDERVGPTIIER
ncbi:hypothetical protein LDENG_00019410 [Lucifuga dentata]|nr:hypothetical protein LDENG_00019410 [Lucifuga dentata]